MSAKVQVKRVEDVREVGMAVGDEQPDHLKIPEVCKRLRLGRTAVYGLMERGELAYVKFGRARRVPRSAVEQLIERATVPARV